MKKTVKDFLLKIGLLSGTIIGAGVFALPYIFKSAGLITGFFYLALGTIVYIAIHLMYAEIVQKTDGDHRFVGYARRHLGEGAAIFSVLMTVIETIFVLTIYLVLSASFGNLIFQSGADMDKIILFWVLGSASIFIGLRRIAWLELLITGGMIGIIVLIFILGAGQLDLISAGDWAIQPGWQALLLPLAPVLFSLSGRQAIPTMVKIGGRVKGAIIAGTILPAIIYGVFILSVLALSLVVTGDAVSGLRGAVPSWTLSFIGVFGLLSLWSSYITIGFDVYKSLQLDLNLKFWLRFLLVIFAPIGVYLAGFTEFLKLVGFVGGIFLALEGIFIIAMWRKATQRKISLPVISLALVFMAALLYEILR